MHGFSQKTFARLLFAIIFPLLLPAQNQPPQHPLDALKTQEYWTVYDVLRDYARAHGGIVLYAPLDIVLTEYDVVQPDLLLFIRERQGLINLRKVARHPPDLAVEILSPSTALNDRGRKLKLLARSG